MGKLEFNFWSNNSVLPRQTGGKYPIPSRKKKHTACHFFLCGIFLEVFSPCNEVLPPPATLLAWLLLAAAPKPSCRQWSPWGKTMKGWSFTTTNSAKLPVAIRLDQVPTKRQVGKYALCLSSSCSSLERRALKAGKFPLSITGSSKVQMESAANTGPKSPNYAY